MDARIGVDSRVEAIELAFVGFLVDVEQNQLV